jgi:hypothetical protein
MMNQRERNDLDNYITGHYGEDQELQPEELVICPKCQGDNTHRDEEDCPEIRCLECYHRWNTRADRHSYIVAVYDTALAYGGPEEGGWWYDHGSLTRIMRIFRHKEGAYRYCRRLNGHLHSRLYGPNQGKREKSSVLSDGVFQAAVYTDYAPKHFPEVRPRYE